MAGAVTVTLAGWLVITGLEGEVTVRMAFLLVVLPKLLLTTHTYWVPLLAAFVAGVV